MSILHEADALINGPRQGAYGHPIDNFGRIAAMWTVILDQQVTAEQVGLCMAALKLARQVHQPSRDNLVDACGYLGAVELIATEQRRRILDNIVTHPHRYKDTTNG
jgi:hypothetical protein